MIAPIDAQCSAAQACAHAQPSGGLAGVFEQHRAELWRFLKARSTNPADADDLLQDLWIRVNSLADRAPPGPIGNPRAYLFRMANNLMLDSLRSRQRSMARDHGWLDAQGRADAAPHQLADPAANAEDAVAEAEEVSLITAAIAALPPGAGRALRLHRIEGLKHEEVARIMGISRSGVEKHLAVAMKHLRAALLGSGLLAHGAQSYPAPSRESANQA